MIDACGVSCVLGEEVKVTDIGLLRNSCPYDAGQVEVGPRGPLSSPCAAGPQAVQGFLNKRWSFEHTRTSLTKYHPTSETGGSHLLCKCAKSLLVFCSRAILLNHFKKRAKERMAESVGREQVTHLGG